MSPPPAAAVLMVTLLVTSWAERVGPEMLSVDKLPTVKSCGLISQVPVVPDGAAVVRITPLAMFTRAADVSIDPPFPPVGAEASKVPATFSVPLCVPPSSLIVPFSPVTSVCA